MADDLAILVQLLPWLVAHPGVSAAQVAAEFGISVKSVLRLIDILTYTGPGQFGGELIEISYGEDGDYIVVHDSQRFDRPLNLDARQASALLAGLNFLRQMPALADSAEVDGLIQKLQDALHPVSVVEVVTSEQERATVELLKRAIHDEVCVDIVYLSGSATIGTQRRIEPKALAVQDDRTFVRAWCHEAQDKRSFRVDRITSAHLTDEAAHVHLDGADFDQDRADWIPAVVEVTREHVGEFDRDTFTAVTDVGDRLRIEVRVATLEWLARVTLAAGGGIRILAPQEGRDLVRAAADAFSARNPG